MMSTMHSRVQRVVNGVLMPMLEPLKGLDGALYVSASDTERICSAVRDALEERWPRKYMVRLEFDGERMSVVLQESGQVGRRNMHA